MRPSRVQSLRAWQRCRDLAISLDMYPRWAHCFREQLVNWKVRSDVYPSTVDLVSQIHRKRRRRERRGRQLSKIVVNVVGCPYLLIGRYYMSFLPFNTLIQATSGIVQKLPMGHKGKCPASALERNTLFQDQFYDARHATGPSALPRARLLVRPS